MKLHLPRLLATALLASLVSAPVYSATIPDGYNPREIYTPDTLPTLNSTLSQPTGLLLTNGTYSYTRNDATATEAFYSGPSLFITSAPEQSEVKMIFTGGYTKAFDSVHALTFADMQRLEFTAMQSGVIYTWGHDSSLTISGITDEKSGNWDVEFFGNKTSGACGGAIDADYARVRIENNGGVRFSENNALAGTVSSENQNQGSTSSGGASASVGQSYTLNLFGYKLSFEFGFGLGFSYEHDNPETPVVEQMDICGGAINLVDSSLTMNNNEAVTFTYNSAKDYGGAISASPGINSTIEISQNGHVLFSENKAHGHVQNDHVAGGGGGAIYIGSQGSLVMNSNTGDIIFSKNLAAAAGGAIYHGGQTLQNEGNSLLWSNNTGNIIFEDNSAGGSGGAIYLHEGGRLEMSGNTGVIRFDRNNAGVSGGAISAKDAFVTLEHNSEIFFCDNLVYHQNVAPEDRDSFSSYYVGGAIYGSNIQIHNNGTVLFQRNAEIADDGSFRLRSIYADGTEEVSLSAASGNSIEFRDSIYVASDLHLNSEYDNQPQGGDIIFTGETTVEDLETVKTYYKENWWNTQNVDPTPTQDEIDNSRTSIVLGDTWLNGGRLRVEKGAIFKSGYLTLNNGSKSTLRINDAKVVNLYNDSHISVGEGTMLEILGHSAIEGGKLIFTDGSKWSFDLNPTHESWLTDSAALTFDGQLNIDGGLTLILNLSNSDMKHWYKLYDGTDTPDKQMKGQWTAGNITVVGTGDAAGATFDDLVWQNGDLYYVGTMVWNNGQNTGEWDFDDKNWQNGRTFNHGMSVRFSNTGSGTVTLTEELSPGSIMVSNDKDHNYTFTAETNEDGTGGKLTYQVDLEKRGDGALTLDLANDHTGTTKLEEGTLNLHDDKALGNSTLTTAEGTTLGVGDGADVVLKNAEHAINGDVVVAEGASLEVGSGSYKATSSTVDGTLTFSQLASEAGTLSGSGTLEVTNGANVKFADASSFTGNIAVTGSSSSLFLDLLDYGVRAGEIIVNAGNLTLQATDKLTMVGGTVLSMVAGEVAERVTTVVADKVIELAQNAIISAMFSSMLDIDGDDMMNEIVGGQIVGAGLTLNAGSTLELDNCHINMNRGNAESTTLTLNVTPEDFEKINLVLRLDEIVNEDSMVLLFSGVDKVNFVFDDTSIGGNGKYECSANQYFTGSMVGENTKLVFNEGNVYLTNLAPEPTTTTLSLLALAALAARRRRR